MTASACHSPPPARAGWTACGGLVLAWLALWFAEFPRPNVDDGFFVGAGAHLAATGRLANPWIAGWLGWLPDVQTEKFFLQPPLYPAALAGWIGLAGVSTASLTAFACLLGIGASLFTWLLFHRLTCSITAAWLAAAVVATWLLFRGLRSDSLAALCAVAGQYCFLRRPDSAGWFGGGLLGAAAVSTHPFWITLVVPATALQILLPRPPTPAPARLAAMAAGIGLTALALVAALGRDVTVFLHDLLAHARFVAPGSDRTGSFIRHFSVGYNLPVNLLLLAMAMVCLALNRRLGLAATIAWLASQALGLWLYAAQSTVFLLLLAAFVPLLLSGSHAGWRRTLHYAPALILGVFFTLHHAVQVLADRQHDARAHRPSLTAWLAAHPPGQVLFDATTLRTMFDYRPPEGSMDLAWAWSPGRPLRWWSPQQLAPRDLWVVNPVWSHGNLPTEAEAHRFVMLGRRFPSVRSSRALLLVVGSDLPAPHSLPFVRSAPP